jgi:hypothetical protein
MPASGQKMHPRGPGATVLWPEGAILVRCGSPSGRKGDFAHGLARLGSGAMHRVALLPVTLILGDFRGPQDLMSRIEMTPVKDPHTRIRMKPLALASGHGRHMNAFVRWGMAVTHCRHKCVTVSLPKRPILCAASSGQVVPC